MPLKVTCPNCNKPVPPELFYSAMGRVRSKKKAAASVRNGAKGGGPAGNKNWKGRLRSVSSRDQT